MISFVGRKVIVDLVESNGSRCIWVFKLKWPLDWLPLPRDLDQLWPPPLNMSIGSGAECSQLLYHYACFFRRHYSLRSYDVYQMPPEVMRVGMACAAQYIHSSSCDWHRCVITGFSDGFVQVGFLSLWLNKCKKNCSLSTTYNGEMTHRKQQK